jgi:hypothetical protein
MHAQVKSGLVWFYILYFPDSDWRNQYDRQQSSFSLEF